MRAAKPPTPQSLLSLLTTLAPLADDFPPIADPPPDPLSTLEASMGNEQAVVRLGDEFDDGLRAKLLEVLRQLGATVSGPTSRAVAGSQEVEGLEVMIGGRTLCVTAETYVGLSISGPDDLVRRVCRLMAQA